MGIGKARHDINNKFKYEYSLNKNVSRVFGSATICFQSKNMQTSESFLGKCVSS